MGWRNHSTQDERYPAERFGCDEDGTRLVVCLVIQGPHFGVHKSISTIWGPKTVVKKCRLGLGKSRCPLLALLAAAVVPERVMKPPQVAVEHRIVADSELASRFVPF